MNFILNAALIQRKPNKVKLEFPINLTGRIVLEFQSNYCLTFIKQRFQ